MAQIPQRRSTSDTPVVPAGAPGKAPRYGVETRRGMAGRRGGLGRPGRRAAGARASRQAAPKEKQPGFLSRAVNNWWNRLLGAVFGGGLEDQGEQYLAHQTTRDYVLNTAGQAAWGGLFPLLTMVCTWFVGAEQAGLFSLAFTVGTLLLFALSRIVTGTALTASAQQAYLTAFLAAHAAEPLAQFLAILVDRTVDTVFTLALVLVLRRAIVGSRIDPQRWTGAIDPNAAHDAVVQPTVPTSTRHVPAVEFLLDEVEEIRTNKADGDTAPERTKPSNGNGDCQ